MTELSPDVKKLMSHARDAFSPSEERLEAVRTALAARLASSGGNGGGSAGGGAVSGIWGTGTWLAVGVLALLAAGGIALNSGAFTRDAGDIAEVSAAVPVSDSADPALAAPIEARATASSALARAPLMAAPALRSVPMVEPRPHRALRVRRAARLPLAAAAPATKVAAVAPPSAVQPAAIAERGATAMPRGDAAPDSTGTAVAAERAESMASSAEAARAPVASAEVVVDESLAREIALLRRARQALAAGQAGTALRLADEHAALFPRGTLRQERLAARALALCALGRSADARAATQALEDVAPRSPHLMRIRASCPTQH